MPTKPKPAIKPAKGFFCDFSDPKYDAWLSRIEHKIDRLLQAETTERTSLMSLQDDVTKLSDDLTTLTTAVNGAIAALQAAAAQITDLKGQVADPAVVAQLEQITSGIEAQTAALSGATPAP